MNEKNSVDELDICDLDPNKICDNCCKCIESDNDYTKIKIDKIIKEEKNGK